MRILSRTYPQDVINVIDAEGHALTNAERGIEVVLHWKEDEAAPRSAEVFGSVREDEDHHAEVGLWFEGIALVDYDGVFEMPHVLTDLLKRNGLDVSYVED